MRIATLKHLRAVDALIVIFLFGLTFFSMIISGAGGGGLNLLGINLAVTAAILGLGRAAASTKNRLVHLVRDFYPVPMIFVAFKEVHVVIQSMSRTDFDQAFIAIDRWLFGADPTVWMARFAHPVLTEVLQVSYASYYVIMVLLGVELYRRDPGGTFPAVVFTITYGFFLSYIGYILFPGVGPRFTLHDFGALNDELPGLWLTNFLRDAINAGESIPKGAADPMALAQRDVFPSGHTQMTLLTMFFAWKHRVRSRHVITVLGTLLIVSTVYLRYHYVIDLAAGAAFMALTALTAPALERAWRRQSGNER
jgi:membrane-associated phospholipid phosphatase